MKPFYAVLLSLGASLLPPHLALAREAAIPAPSAYRVVAEEYGVPYTLLFAIALTESGRALNGATLPWPWVINLNGQPRWYESRADFEADLTRLIESGEHPDVGLMQVNWRYHAPLLGDPSTAVDPWLNLRAGAAVLAKEYETTGDWWRAVGRYHSRDPSRAKRYTQRVSRWYRRVE